LFKKGEIIKKIPQGDIVKVLKEEIEKIWELLNMKINI
jgi:hypothetical protein